MSDLVGLRVIRTSEGDTDSSLPLSPQERQFVEEFFAGEHAGNGTQSYRATHPDASYNTASVEASQLLKSPKIQRALVELHERATSLTIGRLRPWIDFLPLAQITIVATAEGRIRNRLAYEAAIYLTNRVMGAPTANHDLVVRDQDRIVKAVTAFTKRLADDSRRRTE